MNECIHGHKLCVHCFRAEKDRETAKSAGSLSQSQQPPQRRCLCTFVTVSGKRKVFAQPDCPTHGMFERYDAAFAQKKGATLAYHGQKFGY